MCTSFDGQRLAAGSALEFDPVRGVNQTIEDGIGQRGIADDLVPAVDGHLAGDDQRSRVVAIVDDLQQIAALLGGERLWAPVVQNEQIDPGELADEP
jgi:hypothetical protein